MESLFEIAKMFDIAKISSQGLYTSAISASAFSSSCGMLFCEFPVLGVSDLARLTLGESLSADSLSAWNAMSEWKYS